MASISGGDKLGKYLDDLAKKLEQNGTLRVGFLETETYPENGLPVAQIAFWNEYGTEVSPLRPFFRSMIEKNKAGWSLAFGNLMNMNNNDVAKVFALMGEGIKDQLTQSIVEFSDPPNAPSTVRRKGFNKPLIETGTMQRATGWDIE